MIAAATWPRERPGDERLLSIDPVADSFGHGRVRDLPSLLRPGDLVVVNDAATVPASLACERLASGVREAFELRLLGRGGEAADEWRAVVLGAGDWRTPTEDRPPPPLLLAGETFRARGAGHAGLRVVAVDPRSPRLVRIAFDGGESAMWRAIYEDGVPVQYAYMRAPLALWDVQSSFAARPWAVELPSAGRPLTHGILAGLRERGVSVAAITHAAGLSSTGDSTIDALLPLEERYDVPAATVDALARARTAGGRIVAVGTTVVRALEGCARNHGGVLVAGEGVTDLRLGPRDGELVAPGGGRPIADGILTGIHEPGTSHFDLLTTFAKASLLQRALASAEERSYLQHEFGDSVLILSGG